MEHPFSTDVIIVGAGPAGATAAYYLGEAGLRVLVLEKEETLPRYKPCGGGLSAHMLAKWFPFSFDSVIETAPEAITYTFHKWVVTIPITGRPMCMVRRDQFDAYLLSQAQAEVRTGMVVRSVEENPEGVKVTTVDGSVFQAGYLIGADGANSVVARAAGLHRNRSACPALEAEVYTAPEILQRFAAGPWFIVGEVNYGYLWVFPKSDHLSVGIAAIHPKAGELQTTLKKVMAGLGISLEGVPLHGHLIPFYTRPEPLAGARTLLVGDAAGLVDPFTGEGIRLAIKSGVLAAQAIVAGNPEQYPRQVFRQIGASHLVGRAIGWLFYHFQLVGFALLVPNPEITACCLDMLDDRTGYPEVVVRALGSAVVFWLTSCVKVVLGWLGYRPRQPEGSTSERHTTPPSALSTENR
jgi:geranylgeranyl reductase family protein